MAKKQQTNEQPKRVPAIAVTVRGIYRNAVSEDADAEASFVGADAAWITLKFANGEQLEFSTNRLTSDMQVRAMAHGIKQKLVDAAAISRNPETGRSATVEDKLAAVVKVYDRLLAGMWNEPREGGGSGSLLYKALCRVYADKSPESLRDWLAAKSDEQKAALRKNPKIAEAILAIQAESAKDDGIDSDELLGELDDIGEAE